MSSRFYPRNEQARRDVLARSGAQSGPLTFPRADQSRRDGLAVGHGNAQCSVAVTGTAATANEAQIVSGGRTVIFTITGNDRFVNDVANSSSIFNQLVAGLSNTAIRAALVVGNFALSVNGKVLTVTLPAVAAFTSAADMAITWTLPVEAFVNRAQVDTITGAINVTNQDCTVAVTGNAGSCAEADIVNGGKVLVFTITGNDTFNAITAGALLTAMAAGLADGAAGIAAALVAGSFVRSGANKILTVTLPAVAAYSIAADAHYDWTIPQAAFQNRSAAAANVSAINVTNGA
jgi:hypothetical protein